MIFLLGGLMIGHRVLAEVNGMDWLYMMVLYVALVAARFVTMLILFPVISKIGHGCSLKEVCFMSWAGLRGALGMALALIVHKQMYGESSEMSKETSRLLFYVGGISALTLLINATTSKSVLFGLGLLSTNSAEKQLVTNQVKKKLRKKMNQVIGQLTKELNLRTHDLDTTPSSYDSTGIRGMIGRLRRDSTGGASASSQTRLQTVNEDDHHLFDDGTARPVRQVFSQAKRRADTGHGDDEDDDGSASLATDGTPSTANTANILAKSHRLSSKRKSKRGSVRSDRSHSKHASMGHLSGSFYLSGNHLSAKIEASEASRLDYFSRLVSIGNRDSRTILDEDLLAYIRSIFLEIVRVKYWHLIEVGKLPRISHSAQYLLYTIDVSLDDVQNTVPPSEERQSKPTRNLRKRKNAAEEKPLVVPYHLNVAEARSLPGRLLYCTACKCPASASAATKYFVHPLLHVPVCTTCHRQYMLGEFVVEDGNEWFCRWCGQGQGALFLCDTCPKSFCSRCLGANEIQRIRSLQGGAASSVDATHATGVYSCYCCDPSSFDRLCDKNAYWLLWRDTGRRLWDAAHAAKLQRQELNATDNDDADDAVASETIDLVSEDTSWAPSSVEGSRSGDSYRPSSYKAAAPMTTDRRTSRHRSKRSRPSAMSLLPDHVLIAHAAPEKAPADQANETANGREDRFLAADAPAWTHFLIQHRKHPTEDTADGSDLQAAMSFAAAAVFHDAADADDDDSSLHSLSSGRCCLFGRWQQLHVRSLRRST
eukprot:gene2178-1591_t